MVSNLHDVAWGEIAIESLALGAVYVAEIAHIGAYSDCIFSGSSSRISVPLFIEAWDLLHPEAELANLHIFGGLLNEILYIDEPDLSGAVRIEYLQEFLGRYCKHLIDRKENSILYIDDIACSGGKIACLRSTFSSLGFKAMDYAAMVSGNGAKLWEFPNLQLGFEDHETACALRIFAKDYKCHPNAFSDLVERTTEYIRQLEGI